MSNTPMRLTRRGRILVSWSSVLLFVAIMGVAGWIEGMPA